MHRDAGERKHSEGISLSALSKEGQRGRRCVFIIGIGAGKILVCAGFCLNFPKLARKVFCGTFAYKFSSTKIMKTSFWCNLQKQILMCFYANLGRHFLKSNNVGHHFPGFSGLLPRFSANQNFLGCACNPCTTTSNTTTFHNSIIGNFVVYQDRLETNLLQLFWHPENLE